MALRHEASVANRGFLPFPTQTGASSAALGRPNARLVPGCAFKRQSETTSRLHFQPKETKRQCNSERVSWRKLLESTGNEQIYANALQSNAMKLANIIFYRIPMQSIFEWQHVATKKNRKWLKISPGFIISISSAVRLCWSSPCSKMACAWATVPRWPLRRQVFQSTKRRPGLGPRNGQTGAAPNPRNLSAPGADRQDRSSKRKAKTIRTSYIKIYKTISYKL